MGIVDDPNDLDDFERRLRFDEIAARFGRSIAAWECSPWTCELELLERDGIECPDPDAITGWADADVQTLIWTIIRRLAARNVYLHETDHLSDRELYVELYDDILRECTKDYAAVLEPEELVQDGAWVCSISLLDNWADEDTARTYAMYYLQDDDESRKWLGEDFDRPLPAWRRPPYDRDRLMPQPRETPDVERFDEGEVREREPNENDADRDDGIPF